MKKFFSGLLVFFLILIIVVGLGYIGYSYLGVNHSTGANTDQQMQMTTNQTNTTDQTQDTTQQDTSMDSMTSMTDEVTNTTGTSQLSTILKNKEYLDQARGNIDDALKYMTLDPYAPSDSSQDQMDMDMGATMQQVDPQSSTSTTNTTPDSTVINVFDQGTTNVTVPDTKVADSSTQNNTMTSMQSMGTVYDATKMEKLHSGLFKLAIGMQLLEQLSNEFISQAEMASATTLDPIQDYTNSYNLTTKNQASLKLAMGYIEEAANLVNINPYISSTGLVYDQERMGQIHQSLIELANGVAMINLLNNELSSQAIYYANTVQLYVNNANAVNAANAAKAAESAAIRASDTGTVVDTTTHSTMTTGIFDNISISSVVNIILIIFVIGLIFGILGFIFSLFKTPTTKTEKK